MMFMGFYFLASAIVIPNIATVLSSEMSPMTIPSIETIIYALIGLVGLIILGVYVNKKTSNLIQ
jgi:predicted transporter